MLNVSGKKEFCLQWGPVCFLTPCFVALLHPFQKPPALWGWFCTVILLRNLSSRWIQLLGQGYFRDT